MADVNVAPQPGPFSDALVPQPQQLHESSGYEGKTGAAFGLASKFLQGLAQGRVMKYAREQQKQHKTLETVGAYVQNFMSNPRVSPEMKDKVGSQFFQIMGKSALDQLGESTKGKGSKEGVGGQIAHGFKSLIEGMSGGELKGEKLDVHGLTDLMGMMQEGFKPEHQTQTYIDQAETLLAGVQKEMAGKPREEVLQHPDYARAASILQQYTPDAKERLKDFAERFKTGPGFGTKESFGYDATKDDPPPGRSTAAPSVKTDPPPPASGRTPSVMRKDYEPPVAKGVGTAKIGNRDMLAMQELGLVGAPIIRVFNGKPEQVMSVKAGYKDVQGGTYTLDGRRLEGAGDEYKAPPNQTLVWTKEGDKKIGWNRDPASGRLTRAVADGKQISSDDVKSQAKLTVEDKAGVKRFMLQGKDGKFSPALDGDGKEIVSFDSQSKAWQREHDQIHREITRQYDEYKKADAALEKERETNLLRIENMKGDGGNPLSPQEKQVQRDKIERNITDRRKRAKDQSELIMNGIAQSAGLPWRAFASNDQLDEAQARDSEAESEAAWTDQDVSELRDQ
jgi:hypothetical protein